MLHTLLRVTVGAELFIHLKGGMHDEEKRE